MKKRFAKAISLLAALALTVSTFTGIAYAAPDDAIGEDVIASDEVSDTLDGAASDVVDIDDPEQNDSENLGDDSQNAPAEDIYIFPEDQEALDKLGQLEVNAFNIRYVIHTMGADDIIYPDDYSNEELEDMFGGASMTDVINVILDALRGENVQTLALTEGTIIVVSSTDMSKSPFTIKYGENNIQPDESIEYNTGDNSDLVIKPNDGFKLLNITLEFGYYKPNALKKTKDISSSIGEDGCLRLSDSDLKGKYESELVDGVYGFLINVTTAPADAGGITFSEVGGSGAQYTVDGRTGDLGGIQSYVNNDIKGKKEVGYEIYVSVDPAQIAKVKVVQGITETEYTITTENKGFTFALVAADTNVTFTYKEKAGDFSIVPSDIFDKYIASITMDGKVYTNVDSLNADIKNKYVGDQVNLNIAYKNNVESYIDSAKLNGSVINGVSSNLLTIALASTQNTLELSFTDPTPIIQTIVYDKSVMSSVAKTKDQIVVGQVTNYSYLSANARNKITDTAFDISVVNSNNPVAKTKYNITQNAKRSGDVWGVWFTPKEGQDDFNYNYTFDVKATAVYDGTPKSGEVKRITINN